MWEQRIVSDLTLNDLLCLSLIFLTNFHSAPLRNSEKLDH